MCNSYTIDMIFTLGLTTLVPKYSKSLFRDSRLQPTFHLLSSLLLLLLLILSLLSSSLLLLFGFV